MFHTGLVIHYHVWVIRGQLCKLSLQKAVYKTVTAFALSPSHDEHVEIIVFDQTAIHHHFHIVSLGHSGRNLTCRTICRTLHILTDLAECHFHIHTEDLIQIGIGIRISCRRDTESTDRKESFFQRRLFRRRQLHVPLEAPPKIYSNNQIIVRIPDALMISATSFHLFRAYR